MHLLLNYAHKYTEIYNGIGWLALTEVLVIDRGSTPYPSPPELCSQINRHL